MFSFSTMLLLRMHGTSQGHIISRLCFGNQLKRSYVSRVGFWTIKASYPNLYVGFLCQSLVMKQRLVAELIILQRAKLLFFCFYSFEFINFRGTQMASALTIGRRLCVVVVVYVFSFLLPPTCPSSTCLGLSVGVNTIITPLYCKF